MKESASQPVPSGRGADMQEAQPANQRAAHESPGGAVSGPRISRRQMLIFGGIAASGLAAAVGGMVYLGANGEPNRLDTVPIAYLPQVQGTLEPSQAEKLTEQARQCRVPLAQVAIWHSPGTPGGIVSIISGSYHSPSFALQTTRHVVAIPYPAPYPSGRGVLTLVGHGADVNISIYPTIWKIDLTGSHTIPVWWQVKGGCP